MHCENIDVALSKTVLEKVSETQVGIICIILYN